MNDHSFENQQNENTSSDAQRYDVYSREYKPGGNQYHEYSRTYSYASMDDGKKKKNGGVGKSIAVIAVALVLALVIGTVGLLIAARIIFSDMSGGEGTKTPDENRQEETLPEQGDTPNNTQRFPADQEVFFGSKEETEIKVSDSMGETTKGSVGDEGLSVADVAALVRDSVVEITTSETSWNGFVYASGAGSGVIVNESGIILTNNHVIEGATYITVRLTNGDTYDAVLVAADVPSDLAVLKINVTVPLTTAIVGDSDKLIVGQEVIAIGNPLGVLGGTVTDGIISALEREVVIENEQMVLLQHNAAVSPGNSGGALFNMRGELVGIVNAKSSTAGAEGIGFAIPINTVLDVYNDLVDYGYVTGRPDSGLTLETVVRRVGYFYYEYDVCVAASRYTDELKRNDIIVSIDGVAPSDITEAEALLSNHEIGDVVTIVVSRNGSNHTVKLTIREYTPLG